VEWNNPLKILSHLCSSSLKNPLKNFPINLSIRLAFCLSFFVSYSILLFSQAPDFLYFDRLLPSSNGNSLRVIHCITQDRQGFIWITSPYGLARYDGKEYILFEHKAGDPSSLIDNYLFSVLEDSHDNLWITSDKGLDLFDKETGRFIHYQHDPEDPRSLSSSHIRAICEDKDGFLWIGTMDAGINRFDHRTKTFTRFIHDPANTNSPSSDSVWAIFCDQKGKIWSGHSMVNNLDCYDPKNSTWSHFAWLPDDSGEFIVPHIWALCEGQKGQIWMGTSRAGLGRLDPESGTVSFINLKKDFDIYHTDYKILALHQDQEGILWIGTEEAGIFRYNPEDNSLKAYASDSKYPNSLSHKSVLSIFEDREGLLWFGTGNGISLLNKKRFRFARVQHDPETKEGLSDNDILSLYEDKKGIVWIGTARGGLNCWDRKNNQWNQMAFSKSWIEYFLKYPVSSICEDHAGDIWFSTLKGGLVHYQRHTHTLAVHKNSSKNGTAFPNNIVSVVYPGRDGFLWVGTPKHGLIEWDITKKKGTLISYDLKEENRDPYSINTLYVDSVGAVWIGTHWHGIDRLNPQTFQWTHYRHDPGNPNSLPSSTVYSIAEDKAGNIWVGTEAGLCRINHFEQRCQRLSDKISLPDNSGCGLLFDDMDNLWMSSNKGLFKINHQNLTLSIYGPEDGLQGESFNPCVYFKSNSGEMYFGGISGFNHFYPEKITVNTFPPPLCVTSYTLSTRSERAMLFHKLNILEVTKKDLPLTIGLAALSFAFPQKNLYKAHLLDNDNKEIILDNQNWVQLTHLKPGENRLIFYGANHDQQWNSKGVPLIIILSTPFWQSWVFRFSMIILFATIFISWFQIRRRYWRQEPLINIQEDLTPLLRKNKITKREREILLSVLQGKSNKEIEKEFFVSYKTVKSHLYNIYQKIGVKSRLQLMNAVQEYLKKTNSKKIIPTG
jgi:ligand-binding sensor domain-containing protein/DNA-binding CsgD family transcriptional regulator